MTNGFQIGRFDPRRADLGGAVQQGLQIRRQFDEGQGRRTQQASDVLANQMPFLVEAARRTKLLQTSEDKINTLQTLKRNFTSAGLSTEVLDQGIQQLQSGDIAGFEQVTDRLIEFGDQATGKSGLASAKTKIFGDGTTIQALPGGEVQVRNPAGDVVTGEQRGKVLESAQAAEIALVGGKAKAKAVGTATGEAETAPLIAKARATIATAVTLATKEATARGETLTDLARSEAALPGLRDTVGQLKELAAIATSTLGGRIFDVAVKESGFGSTEGATARAKFIAIVNNQVLPLLKQTFGGSFSVEEGKELKASMGDPDSTLEEKLAQLDAFIDQKVRTIQGQQREVGQDVTLTEELATGQALFSGALNREITEQDITDTLAANPGTTREALLQQLQVQ